MLPKKRLRNEAQQPLPHYSRKQQRVSVSSVQKNYDIWTVLSKVTQSKKLERLNLEKPIKASQIFICITKSEYLKLPLFVADLKRTLDSEAIAIVLHPSFIELKSFSLLQACVAITAIVNHLNELATSSKVVSYFGMNSSSVLRGCVVVHKSTKVQQTETSQDVLFKRNSTASKFKCQLATVSSIKGFKEVYLEAETPKDWMCGIMELLSQWKFRPVNTDPVNSLSNELEFRKQSLSSTLQEMPFLQELFDDAVIKHCNKPLLESDIKALDSFMTELREYNEKEIPQISAQGKSMSAKLNRFSSTRISEKPSKNGVSSSNTATGSRFQGHGNIQQARNRTKEPFKSSQRTIESSFSAESVRQYCLATIQAAIAKTEEKSSFQIIRTYVKCPRYSIPLLQQNINSIKSHTNCNVVILNLQTIHESTLWFQQLQITTSTNPPPNLTRVVSVGGVGGKCKKALEMIYSLVSSNS